MSSPRTSPTTRTRRETGPSIRARGGLARSLLILLLPLTLGPLVIFAAVVYGQVRTSLRSQVESQLNSLANLKITQIRQWAAARAAGIENLAASPDVVALSGDFLSGAATEAQVIQRFNYFLNLNPNYSALVLARASDGVVIAAPEQYQPFMGESLAGGDLLARAREGAFVLAPTYQPQLGGVQLAAVAPVAGPNEPPAALIFGFDFGADLVQMTGAVAGLGASSRATVITSDGYQLGRGAASQTEPLHSAGIDRARMAHENGSAIYVNQFGTQVFGAYRWLPDYQLTLLVELNTQEAFAPLAQFAGVLAFIAALAAVVSLIGVVSITRRLLTGPLEQLAAGAQRLASGDLNSQVGLQRQDEIGLVANAFNQMSAELRDLYQDLESKVEARTQQLAAAAEVARAASSTLSADDLLRRTVDLIRDRFGYYHVSIFLLDESGRWAGLRESTGAAGEELKARGHGLAVGSTSIIGWVTANGQPRIALDVGGDEVYFQNDLLPDTRSEAAVPLRVGARVIGALDVQSRSLNAFNQADIEILQVLADQIAVAVENSRLFARQERVAQIEQRVAALTAQVHRSLNVDTILQTAATGVGQAFGASKVVVRLNPTPAPAGETPETAHRPHGGNGGNGSNSLSEV